MKKALRLLHQILCCIYILLLSPVHADLYSDFVIDIKKQEVKIENVKDRYNLVLEETKHGIKENLISSSSMEIHFGYFDDDDPEGELQLYLARLCSLSKDGIGALGLSEECIVALGSLKTKDELINELKVDSSISEE